MAYVDEFDDPMDEDTEPGRADAGVFPAYLRTGPFASGSRHTWLTLGEPPPRGPDSLHDSAAGQPAQAGSRRRGSTSQPAEKKSRSRGGQSKPTKPRTTLSLKDLLDHGILAPGRNKIQVVYKGSTYSATLTEEGQILYQGKKFTSATSFSIHCKRQLTPNKQGDDGWKSVQYEGQALDHFRRAYYRLFALEDGEDAAATLPVKAVDPVEGAGTEAAAGGTEAALETDQWVQCDRCRTWRIVPDESWPSIQEDTRDVWFCEDANWDVSKYEPFKGPCHDG